MRKVDSSLCVQLNSLNVYNIYLLQVLVKRAPGHVRKSKELFPPICTGLWRFAKDFTHRRMAPFTIVWLSQNVYGKKLHLYLSTLKKGFYKLIVPSL